MAIRLELFDNELAYIAWPLARLQIAGAQAERHVVEVQAWFHGLQHGLRQDVLQEEADLLIARDDVTGTIVGAASFDERTDHMFISAIAVAIDRRREGIAKELLLNIRRRAQACGSPKLVWRCEVDNGPALAMSEAVGAETAELLVDDRTLIECRIDVGDDSNTEKS